MTVLIDTPLCSGVSQYGVRRNIVVASEHSTLVLY